MKPQDCGDLTVHSGKWLHEGMPVTRDSPHPAAADTNANAVTLGSGGARATGDPGSGGGAVLCPVPTPLPPPPPPPPPALKQQSGVRYLIVGFVDVRSPRVDSGFLASKQANHSRAGRDSEVYV